MKKPRLTVISAVTVWGYYDQNENLNGSRYYADSDAVRVETTADASVHQLSPDGGPYAAIYNLKDTDSWILDHAKWDSKPRLLN